MARIKHSFRNIIFGVGYKLVRTLMPFVIRTIIIHKLGTEYAGLDSLFTSVLQTLSLAELGFGSALCYSMYKPIAEGDSALVSALLNYYRKAYRVIGVIISAIGIMLLPFLPNIVKGGYPEAINIYILYILYLANTVSSYFLFAYSQSLLTANQRSDIVTKIHLLSNMVMYVLQIVVLLTVGNYYIYTLILLIGTLGVNIGANAVARRKFSQYRCAGALEASQKRAISQNVRSLVGHKISGVVLNSADNIVVSAFLGLSFVALYSNYFFVINGVAVILSVCFEAITASVGNSIALESKEKNYRDFLLFSDISDWVIGMCSVCLIGLYQSFIDLWVGEGMLLPAQTMVFFVIYFYVNMIRKITLTYKDAAGMWWADFWKPYVGTIANIVLNVILVQIIGLDGVVLSSVFAMLVISLPWGAWALHKHYFAISQKKYYLKMLYHTVLAVIACGAMYFIGERISIDGVKGLVVRLVISLVVANIVYAAGFAVSKELSGVFGFGKKVLGAVFRRTRNE